MEKAKARYEQAEQKLTGHKRSPSASSDTITQEHREKAAAIDSMANTEPLEGAGPLRRAEPLESPAARQAALSAGRVEPRVLHGRTLTSDISFRDVCKTIRETAFVQTDLPIVVSLEVHADLQQQEVMVEIMREEWAGLLLEFPYAHCDPETMTPTLEDLRKKILVKVKKASTDRPYPVSSDSFSPHKSSDTLAPHKPHEEGDSGQSGSEDERGGKKKKKSKICEALSNLGIYTRSTHFKSFEQPEAKVPAHIFSISENDIMDLHLNQRQEMFLHNRGFFMRAYPAGWRVDSSNPDPSIFWRKGVQMVALNWQSWDEGMMLNEGMFADEQGWVLKPPGYRDHDVSTTIKMQTLDFSIQIFAGQHIPLPEGAEDDVFHPYVKCQLHVERAEEHSSIGASFELHGDGSGSKTRDVEYKRHTRSRKGVEPDFAGETMSFVGITDVVEELSFVRSVTFHIPSAGYR